MSRVKTFTNGGSLLPADLNSIQDDYEGAYSTYKSIVTNMVYIAGATTAATYAPYRYDPVTIALPSLGTAAYTYGFYFDPAWHATLNRTTKVRVAAQLSTNVVAPTVSFTIALRSATVTPGSAGNPAYLSAYGSAVASLVFTTPSASVTVTAVSSDVTAPAAGWYVMTFTPSGTTAATSTGALEMHLQTRNV